MSHKSYSDRLKDPRWQKRRLKVMESAGFRCENCGEKTKTLNVHHKYYERGADPWDYPDFALACLCEDCHEAAEHERLTLLRFIALNDFSCTELLGYVKAVSALGLDKPTRIRIDDINELEGASSAVGVGWSFVETFFDSSAGWLDLPGLLKARKAFRGVG